MSICGKIFERLIFNSLFEYLEKLKLLSAHQSGFWANDFCVDQLLCMSIIFIQPLMHIQLLNCCFLDMSRVFDKVWHEWLIFKLKSMLGISSALLDLIKSFLDNMFHVLNGHMSEWLPVKTGVLQWSILGPLFFLTNINDLSIDILSTLRLLAWYMTNFHYSWC